MKITQKQFRELIVEEVKSQLNENKINEDMSNTFDKLDDILKKYRDDIYDSISPKAATDFNKIMANFNSQISKLFRKYNFE